MNELIAIITDLVQSNRLPERGLFLGIVASLIVGWICSGRSEFGSRFDGFMIGFCYTSISIVLIGVMVCLFIQGWM